MRALLLLGFVLTGPASAHRLPDVFTTGQRLIDQFDPDITPKVLYSADGTFVAQVPAGGWSNNAELYRHIRSIDAENGRWYIRAQLRVTSDKRTRSELWATSLAHNGGACVRLTDVTPALACDPKALQNGGNLNETESLAKLAARFNEEVFLPSSELKGGFV